MEQSMALVEDPEKIERAKKRGKAYQCLWCHYLQKKRFVDIKCRVEDHIIKNHLDLEAVPFYCKLCYFRCQREDQWMSHVTKWKKHIDLATQGKITDHQQSLVRNFNPHVLGPLDYTPLSSEESLRHFLGMRPSGREETQPPNGNEVINQARELQPVVTNYGQTDLLQAATTQVVTDNHLAGVVFATEIKRASQDPSGQLTLMLSKIRDNQQFLLNSYKSSMAIDSFPVQGSVPITSFMVPEQIPHNLLEELGKPEMNGQFFTAMAETSQAGGSVEQLSCTSQEETTGTEMEQEQRTNSQERSMEGNTEPSREATNQLKEEEIKLNHNSSNDEPVDLEEAEDLDSHERSSSERSILEKKETDNEEKEKAAEPKMSIDSTGCADISDGKEASRERSSVEERKETDDELEKVPDSNMPRELTGCSVQRRKEADPVERGGEEKRKKTDDVLKKVLDLEVPLDLTRRAARIDEGEDSRKESSEEGLKKTDDVPKKVPDHDIPLDLTRRAARIDEREDSRKESSEERLKKTDDVMETVSEPDMPMDLRVVQATMMETDRLVTEAGSGEGSDEDSRKVVLKENTDCEANELCVCHG